MLNKNLQKKWNNNWKKNPVIYDGRVLRNNFSRIPVDVKNFISKNDEILKKIIKRNRLKKTSYDKTAHAIQKWVVRNLNYKYDKDNNKCEEFWQFSFETLYSQIGDCEDGAILICALCINAGIPSFRCKVAAGMVKPSETAPEGGHAYCIYLASDNKWRILDWCFFEDSRLKTLAKPLASEGGFNKSYGKIWFTFNDEFSWVKRPGSLNGRITDWDPPVE